MFGTHDLALFVLSGLLLNVTPGPDTLYIVGRSTAQGRRAGAAAAFGIGAGCFVHTIAAAVGLSAILAASAAAFTGVELIGAAYLVYLGITLWHAKAQFPGPETTALPGTSLRNVFAQGFLINVLNPKVALFFLAFLPQFIDAAAPGKTAAFLFLGSVFIVNGTLWNLFVAWSAANIGRRIEEHSNLGVWLNRIVGSVLVCLGIKLALTGQR
jgi:threonine/homoserine/homoserine lactone efflux protein